MATPIMLAASALSIIALVWLGWRGHLALPPDDQGGGRSHAGVLDGAGIGVLLLIAALGSMLASALGVGVASGVMGLDPRGLATASLLERAVLQWVAVAAGVLAIGVLAFLWSPIGLALGRWFAGGRAALLATALLLPAVWGVGVASALVHRMLLGEPPGPIAHDTLSAMLASPRDMGWWLMMLAVVVGAPVIEELVYRGLLLIGLARLASALQRDELPGRMAPGRWIAIIVSAALFAMVHLGVAAWIAMPSLFALGVGLAWLRLRTGGLLAPIVVHAAFNAMNLVLAQAITGSPHA